MRARHQIEYCLFQLVCSSLKAIPLPLARSAGRAIGLLWYMFDPHRRRVALFNLRLAFGNEKSPKEIGRIARLSFQNAGVTFVELCHLMKWDAEWVAQMVEPINYERLLKVKARNRGVLLFTAHMGNWELMALYQSVRDAPMAVLSRPLDNPMLNRQMNEVRTKFGNCIIPKAQAVKSIIQLLRSGGVVGVLMDQNTVCEEGVFVEFFGRPACTTPFIAAMALRFRAPVLPAFTFRTAGGKHAVVVGEEVPLEITGDPRRDLVSNTARFTKIIEETIREHPEQWLWMHKRWRTQPADLDLWREEQIAPSDAIAAPS